MNGGDGLRLRHFPQVIVYLAFGGIIIFVLAQVLWWIIFQQRYVHSVTLLTLNQWQLEADLANIASTSTNTKEKLLAEKELTHLILHKDNIIVNPQAISHFEKQQQKHIRMFKYEGPVFVTVVLLGLLIIYQNLQAERELKRRQENFLSAISHEFNTPIATLKLLVQTLKRHNLSSEKSSDYLEKMVLELKRLEVTSEQVLASARLEHSLEVPKLTTHDLNRVVRNLINKVRASLEARGASLDLHYTTYPLLVSIDPQAFSLILTNLLENALKYSVSPEKPIKVRLEDDNYLIKVHVEDEGIGINPKDIKHIFEKFYRAGNELTREFKGVGLGLYLVKSISEAMNGWVKCEPLQKGTRFTVVFPRVISAKI